MLRKYKSFSNFEKEEVWLNEMARSGWKFAHRNSWGAYYFDTGVIEQPNYRIDYRTFRKQEDFKEYVQLFIDNGWQHICGTRYSGTQYFLSQRPNADDDIFSDNISKAGRYKRLSIMWAMFLVTYTALFISMCINGTVDLSVFLHPKELYLTPGLWELTGSSFWLAFLFETPFVLMRSFSWLLYIIVIICFLYLTIRAVVESKKHKY